MSKGAHKGTITTYWTHSVQPRIGVAILACCHHASLPSQKPLAELRFLLSVHLTNCVYRPQDAVQQRGALVDATEMHLVQSVESAREVAARSKEQYKRYVHVWRAGPSTSCLPGSGLGHGVDAHT